MTRRAALNELGLPPAPVNEAIRGYLPGSPERRSLRAALAAAAADRVEMPCVIGGRDLTTGNLRPVVMPHDHAHVLGDAHLGGPVEALAAVEAALAAGPAWAATPWRERAAVFLRAADLLAGPWRDRINAATMLGQSKTVHQAEIDSACELCDFLRFNVAFAAGIYAVQPESSPGVWNRLDYRPLEGFVFAVSPFNFTSIAGNLPSAPALMGNTVVWKPAEAAALAAHHLMRLFQAAGLPDGVINLLHGEGPAVAPPVIGHRDLAGIHFTGSTAVFRGMWSEVGRRIDAYRTFPRLVGETGGKNFVIAHASAGVDELVAAVVRGGFEYQGQKCSAASRVFIPDSLWPEFRDRLLGEVASIRMGDPADFGNFVAAVIDERAFARQRAAIEEARRGPGLRILAGGETDGSTGWFVTPTVVQADDPWARLMREELFGPIVTAHVYPERSYPEVLELVDRQSEYALTGAIFARDRAAIEQASSALAHAAGNFYVNDKPTGAVVGQQPFGGARASGTNDKAGSLWNLARWTSPRTIKETSVPVTDYRYAWLRGDDPI